MRNNINSALTKYYRNGFKEIFLIYINMNNLPEDVFNKIMLYNTHPVADLFKKELEE